MHRTIENFALFQLGWLGVVMLGASHYHWLAPVLVVVIIARHIMLSGEPRRELKLVTAAFVLGLCWESALTSMDVVFYPQGQIGGLAPAWIVFMWPMLATTLNVSLRWLHRRVWYGALFGAIGGPLAFLAGEKLGAVVLPDFVLAMAVLGVGWSVLFPLLVGLAWRLDGALGSAQKALSE